MKYMRATTHEMGEIVIVTNILIKLVKSNVKKLLLFAKHLSEWVTTAPTMHILEFQSWMEIRALAFLFALKLL